MKKFRTNLFILIFTFIVLTVNLTSNVFATPVANQNPAYKSSNLKIQRLSLTEELAIPNHLNVSVENRVISYIKYEDFYLEAKRINTDIGPAYCLEVEKDYPTGQTFEFAGKPAREITGMMAAGFPNKSAAELGLASDDEAYFATQMAVWCVTEGYNPAKFKSDNKVVLKAIKNIYAEGMKYTGVDLDHTAMEYYYSENIQRIVVYINKAIEVPDEGTDEGTGGGNEEVPTLPEVPDDEEEVEIPEEEDTSEKVVVPGLG